MYKCNEVRSRHRFFRGKAISIMYSERVSVALVMQHSKRMRRVILLSVVCLPVPHFSTLSHEGKTSDFLYKFRLKHF
jgi:hypothetical protein